MNFARVEKMRECFCFSFAEGARGVNVYRDFVDYVIESGKSI